MSNGSIISHKRAPLYLPTFSSNSKITVVFACCSRKHHWWIDYTVKCGIYGYGLCLTICISGYFSLLVFLAYCACSLEQVLLFISISDTQTQIF